MEINVKDTVEKTDVNNEISDVFDLCVEDEYDNCRLDKFLTDKFSDMSRSYIQKQIKKTDLSMLITRKLKAALNSNIMITSM